MNKRITYFLFCFLCSVIALLTNAQNVDSLSHLIIQDSIYQTTVPPSENFEFKEPGDKKIEARQVPDNKVKEIKSDEDYWYVDQAPSGDRESTPPSVNQKGEKERQQRITRSIHVPSWLRVLFWIILVGGFLTLLVWFLSTSDIRLFRKKTKPVDEEDEEQGTENIFEMNFEKEIQNAIAAKNYRLAVRLMYLRALKDLARRNLINYTHEKTNSDYLFQLAGTPYYKNFFRLTRSFDYTWYGHFELSQDRFGHIQADFSSFKQQLS